MLPLGRGLSHPWWACSALGLWPPAAQERCQERSSACRKHQIGALPADFLPWRSSSIASWNEVQPRWVRGWARGVKTVLTIHSPWDLSMAVEWIEVTHTPYASLNLCIHSTCTANVIWFYMSPGSGVFVNVKNTLQFDELTMLGNKSMETPTHSSLMS